MLKTTRSILLAAGALALAAVPLSAAERLHPGQWEFTILHADGDTSVSKHCITADEATSVNGDTKTARAYAEKKAAGRCTITAYDVQGNSVSYAMKCGAVSIRTTAVFHGDTSESDQTAKNGSEPEVVTHVKAKRLGDCP